MQSLKYRVTRLTMVGVLSALVLPTAFAAKAATSFKAVDANGDGLISQKEFADHGGFKQAFQDSDTNLDFHLTPEEYNTASALNERIRTGTYVDDAWITAKVKMLLLRDDNVKDLNLSVETHKGMVQLSGWVNTPTQIVQAEKVAYAVEGVKGIKNDLQIKR